MIIPNSKPPVAPACTKCRAFGAEGVNVFEGGYEAGDFLLHVVFFPIILFCFPNNWKIDGDYPSAGGQRIFFWEGFTEKRRGAEAAKSRGEK
jgi:hypothetical protein